ncbi:MAG: hypothetical protein ACRDAS_01610 [Cetobacterium sp.]
MDKNKFFMAMILEEVSRNNLIQIKDETKTFDETFDFIIDLLNEDCFFEELNEAVGDIFIKKLKEQDII